MAKRMWLVAAPNQRMMRAGVLMRAPYGLTIIENCLNCPHREDRLFCDLPSDAVRRLSEITSPATYPKGAMLFVEGQNARGVFIVCAGKVKLSTTSADGKSLIVRIVDAGEVMGLAATVSGKPYYATAEVIEPTQANFIGRNDFLSFLHENAEVSYRVAQQLSENYQNALAEMKTIGLSRSAAEKVARFIIDWCASHDAGEGKIRAKLTLTHEEIGQMVGASRETVTRVLAEFKKKQYVQIHGSTIVVRNKAALENLVDPQT